MRVPLSKHSRSYFAAGTRRTAIIKSVRAEGLISQILGAF